MRYLQEMGNILVMISIIFCCDCLRCVCYPFVFVFNFTLPFHFIFPQEYFGSCGDILATVSIFLLLHCQIHFFYSFTLFQPHLYYCLVCDPTLWLLHIHTHMCHHVFLLEDSLNQSVIFRFCNVHCVFFLLLLSIKCAVSTAYVLSRSLIFAAL